jgi:hypothetical protein
VAVAGQVATAFGSAIDAGAEAEVAAAGSPAAPGRGSEGESRHETAGESEAIGHGSEFPSKNPGMLLKRLCVELT